MLVDSFFKYKIYKNSCYVKLPIINECKHLYQANKSKQFHHNTIKPPPLTKCAHVTTNRIDGWIYRNTSLNKISNIHGHLINLRGVILLNIS